MAATNAPASAGQDFLFDIATLKRGELRKKYQGEANCHSNMKRRAKLGGYELDEAWNDFATFLADMGPRPDPTYSIDRIDNTLRRYGKGLCRWSSKEEQTRNRSNTRWILCQGERITVGEFTKRIGRPYSTVASALDRGMSADQIAKGALLAPRTGAYFPPWADTDDKRTSFNQEFVRWHRKVRRSDRRTVATRQAFGLIAAAKMYVGAGRALAALGIDQTIPQDFNEFERSAEKLFRIRRQALSWAQHAAWSLAEIDERQAARFIPTNEAELMSRVDLDEWFTQPLDE